MALYYPWLTVRDPETEALLAVPPAGHVAGVYARTDLERGVQEAPANAVIEGLFAGDAAGQGPLVSTVTAAEQEILNPRGVNCLRDFRDQGRGVRVRRARTASGAGEWRYVAVRRLALFVEQSLRAGTRWVLFEPSDEPLWHRVVGTVTGFLGTRVLPASRSTSGPSTALPAPASRRPDSRSAGSSCSSACDSKAHWQ